MAVTELIIIPVTKKDKQRQLSYDDRMITCDLTQLIMFLHKENQECLIPLTSQQLTEDYEHYLFFIQVVQEHLREINKQINVAISQTLKMETPSTNVKNVHKKRYECVFIIIINIIM